MVNVPVMKLSSKIKGIMWIIVSLVMFALLNCMMRMLTDGAFHPFQILAYRSLCGLVLGFIGLTIIGLGNLGNARLNKTNLIRGLFDFTSIYLWVAAISHMEITQAVSITFLTPIFGVILAAFFLNDKMSQVQWIACITAFIGAYIAANPNMHGFNIHSIKVVVTCLLWASSGILLKKLTIRKQHPLVIITYTNLIIFIATLPFIYNIHRSPSVDEMALLLAMGVVGFAGSLTMVLAYQLTRITNLLPLEYLKLIFTAVFAFFLFEELIRMNTILGSVLILSASFYISKSAKDEPNEKQA